MAVDYDLVILGGTSEGYDAADYAAQLGARVAWVLNGQDGRRSPLFLETLIASHLALKPVADRASWSQAIAQATLTADRLTQDDFQRLMVRGVDVIPESGGLISHRPLRIETTTRHLTARSVLLATGNRPRVSPIPGLTSVTLETPASLLQQPTVPTSVVVLGSAPLGLVLCQVLRRYGVAVTLVTPSPRLLNREDPDVSRWITAQLQAEGVTLRPGAEIAEVAAQDNGISMKLSDEEITASSLVLALPPVPNLDNGHNRLSSSSFEAPQSPILEEQRVRLLQNLETPTDGKQGDELRVSGFLQTQFPRIYACGSVIGGYNLTAIARQEARLAVGNALFWNRDRIDYCTIPYRLSTQPEMVRVGLTESQARQRYGGDDLLVIRQPLYDNAKAQRQGATTGFCKIIAHRRGEILGMHGVGLEASEWVQTMALLISRGMHWWEVARFPTLPYSLTEILRQATQPWERDRWRPGQWRRDWAENWFNWRRSR